MSDKPHDPAQEAINQDQNFESSFEGQQGYGVDYEQGRFRRGGIPDVPPTTGRAGDYGDGNRAEYGSDARDLSMQDVTEDTSALPPDPEALQGQGGE